MTQAEDKRGWRRWARLRTRPHPKAPTGPDVVAPDAASPDVAAPGPADVPRPAGTPSRSSQAVAMVRAELTRPHTPGGDPGAQAALCEGMRPVGTAALRVHIVARTKFFDRQVLAALERGVTQIVILGAGYDDRALRFRSSGVHYIEVDHPDTQTDKRSRIERMGTDTSGLTFAPADFRYDKVADVLAEAGHNPGEASLFICEGLLVYLDQPATVELLGGLRSRANTASCLAASLSVHPDGADSAEVVARANAGRRNAVNEPWRTILPAAGQRELLARAGWTVAESHDELAFDPEARPGRSMLAVARPDGDDPGR